MKSQSSSKQSNKRQCIKLSLKRIFGMGMLVVTIILTFFQFRNNPAYFKQSIWNDARYYAENKDDYDDGGDLYLSSKNISSSNSNIVVVNDELVSSDNSTILFSNENNENDHKNTTTTTSLVSLSPRPLFIIHVGPPKTGSTTFQCTLESLRNTLEEDDYAFIGRPECIGLPIATNVKTQFRTFASALVTDYTCHNSLQDIPVDIDNAASNNSTTQIFECWRDFIDRVENYRKQNRNIIFSDEALSNRIAGSMGYRPTIPYPWDALFSVLKDWDVHFLTLHRPLYDYLPSVYNEIHKVGPGKLKLHRWYKTQHNDDDENNGSEDKCIDQGGRKVPKPFDIEKNIITIGGLIQPQQNLYPTPMQIYEILQKHSSNITLVDMQYKNRDTGDDFISHIVCQFLPGAHETCKALRQMKQNEDASTKKRNPSIPLHYDIIATEACKRGLFNGSLVSREFVRNSLRHYHEEVKGLTANDLPLDCPDNETKQSILEMSLDHERKLRGIGWGMKHNEVSESTHQFWKVANEKKKFCTVDPTLVVEDAEWINFLQELREER